MEASIHKHYELEFCSISDIKPVELITHNLRQTVVVLPSVSDDVGS